MTIVISILGLILLIVIHELGHMLTAKAVGVRVPEFGVGFGPPIFRRKFGKTIYSFRIILLGGFAKMAGMGDGETGPGTYYDKSAWRRAAIIFAGPLANFVAAVAILAGVFMFSGVITGATNEVREVVPGSMAAGVGVEAGDRIVSVDGRPVADWEDFTSVVSEKRPGEAASLVVATGDEERTLDGTLQASPDDPERALVGVSPEPVRETYGLFESVGMAFSQIGQIMVALVGFIGQLITGQESFYDNVTGPVGIVSVSSESVTQGIYPVLLAFISLNLAVFNLLPLLPLDGGHLLFIALEKVFRRPISEATMNKVALFGIMLVLTLFLFATYADLSKLFTGQPFIPDQ
ncbi:M50 family metallopeptidase [Rubrobacter indicoceani]|uniref:M50 family metallopeptidase n=1 Tax=Rubrobacter indicoceani TaxID=2051957 RepID=UPI000E5B8C43|nr:M50 family metallopeptidase [Rubrobacter indicoceani]